MADIRAPAAVINLLNEEEDPSQLTPRKRGRGQAPPGPRTQPFSRGIPARHPHAASPSRNQVAPIVLVDAAGDSDDDAIIDLSNAHGKAPIHMQRHSKRSRGAFVDLTGNEDESFGHAGPHRAGSQLLDHAGNHRRQCTGLESEQPRHEVGLDERPGPSRWAEVGPAVRCQPAGPPGAATEEHAFTVEGRLDTRDEDREISEPGPSSQQGYSEPISVSDTQPDSAPVEGPVQQLREATFSCAVCYDDHPIEDCFIASMCRHKLCRDAAREVILGAIKSCTFPVLCPICQAKADPSCAKCERRRADLESAAAAGHAGDGGANGPASWCCSFDADIPLLLSVEEEEQYLARSLKAATNSCPDLLPCPQADCDGVAVAGGEGASPQVVCNVCQHNWCKSCNVAWHNGLSCDQYQRQVGEAEADKGLKDYQAANKIVRCPTCRHGIEKTDGCNRVMCSGCKTNVCWLCGAKLPQINPYSHFTSMGCPNVGGGEALKGGGIPAGAWAGVQRAPAPHPIAAAALAAAIVAVPAAGAVANAPNAPAAAGVLRNILPVPRNRRSHRRRRNQGR